MVRTLSAMSDGSRESTLPGTRKAKADRICFRPPASHAAVTFCAQGFNKDGQSLVWLRSSPYPSPETVRHATGVRALCACQERPSLTVME